ncbi:MAG: hypothetical protein K8L91_16100 [Anaerolineae bacterium]|nr:hypothetical protein [Anaerolineae bacterium]
MPILTRFTIRLVMLHLLIGLVLAAGFDLERNRIAAQDDPRQQYFIYRSSEIENISWSADSTRLIFQDPWPGFDVYIPGVDTAGYGSWYDFSVETDQTARTDYWPLQPTLTPEQYAQFEIYRSADAISFIFPSPDGQYIVYAYSSSVPHIGIANPASGQHHIIDRNQAFNLWIPIINQFNGVNTSMGVMWSDDSSAVAIQSFFLGGGDYVHYVTNLSDLDHLVVRDLTSEAIEASPDRSDAIYLTTLFDISADGQRLLLGDRHHNPHRILQWDVSSGTATTLPSLGKIAGAAFYGASEDHVMYIDQEGFKIGEIGGDMQIYNPMITSTWADSAAYFSPDGQYVALYCSISFPCPALYLLETGLDSFAQ